MIGGRWQRVEYESLRMLCFHCGKFGHDVEACPLKEPVPTSVPPPDEPSHIPPKTTDTRKHENEMFGPWMVAKKHSKKTSLSSTSQVPTAPKIASTEHSPGVLASSSSPHLNSPAVASTSEPVEFVPDSPQTTSHPITNLPHGSDVIGIGIYVSAREKEDFMCDDGSSHDDELSDDILMDATDPSMQG